MSAGYLHLPTFIIWTDISAHILQRGKIKVISVGGDGVVQREQEEEGEMDWFHATMQEDKSTFEKKQVLVSENYQITIKKSSWL